MLGLTLLLNTASTAMDQLCLARMKRDLGVLTPEYLDPSLHLALEGQACEAETKARRQLGDVARQFRLAGSAVCVRAVLAHCHGGRQLLALLMLAAAGEWESTARLPNGGEIHRRRSADGQVYLLAGAPAAPARHAPHAVRSFSQQLWLLPSDHPAAEGNELPQVRPLISTQDAADSLSLDAALRDLMLVLQANGAEDLAESIMKLSRTGPAQIQDLAVQPGATPVAA